MKYVLLIRRGDAPTPFDQEALARRSPEERRAGYAGHRAIDQAPGVTPGGGLRSPETATPARVEDGGTLVSVEEALGGWLTCEADDLDAAIEPAARPPAARLGGRTEVRPVHEW